jgi:type I restriction enzyme S subunit
MKKCKLGDLFKIKQGYAFKSEKYLPYSKYRLCTLGNFDSNNDFQYNDSQATYYSNDFPKEFILNEGDLILPLTEQTVGLFGNSAFVPHTDDYVFVLNQRVGKIAPYEEQADIIYLHYLLSTELVRKQIEATSSGTKQRNTSPEKMYDVDTWVPNIKEQQQIGEVLHNFELKIQLNNRIICELEAMAKTIYDYWFTQFDFPNAEGKPYRLSGGVMVWNEEIKKEIPDWWKVGSFYDIASFINGLACQKYRPKNEKDKMPVVKIKEMKEGFSKETEYVRTSIPDKNKIDDGDILFSWSVSLEVMIWCAGKSGLNQHIFKVVPNKNYSSMFVYQSLRAYIINFVNMALSRKTTMGHITTDHLLQSRIIIPDHNILTRFAIATESLYKQYILNKSENLELRSIRDFLLPMLMNGQVTIKS